VLCCSASSMLCLKRTQQNVVPNCRQLALKVKSPASNPNAVVLVVDDDHQFRKAVSGYLGGLGYRVVGAATGEQGYRSALELKSCLCVLILDLIMPEGGGWELARRARSILPDLPVVFVSGLLPANVTEGLCSHPPRTVFLEKPFEFSVLKRTLEVVCGAQSSDSNALG